MDVKSIFTVRKNIGNGLAPIGVVFSWAVGLSVVEGLTGAAWSLCVSWVAGGARVLHPRALLSDVHVRWRVGHTWPEYPPALLPSVEVQSHSRCLSSFCPVLSRPKSSARFIFQVFPPAGRRL